MVGHCLNYAAAVFSVLAAVLWWKSAAIKTPTEIIITTDVENSAYDDSASGNTYSADLDQLTSALREQSNWSARAAVSAGIAAVLAGLALIV